MLLLRFYLVASVSDRDLPAVLQYRWTLIPENQRIRYLSMALVAGLAPVVSPVLSCLKFERISRMWRYLIPAIAAIFDSAVVQGMPRLDSSESSISTTRTIDKSVIWACSLCRDQPHHHSNFPDRLSRICGTFFSLSSVGGSNFYCRTSD